MSRGEPLGPGPTTSAPPRAAGGAGVARGARAGLVVVLLGLLLQLVATFTWSPGTFILSAAIGLPLVLAGAAIFGWAVLRGRQARETRQDGPEADR